jgi:hypothetical protein
MTSAKKGGFMFYAGKILTQVLLVPLALATVCAGQQSQPLLQITSPTAGTVVNPGQTMTVAVTSPASASFSQVAVIGEDPIGFSSIATSVPAQFSFTIPTDIACRTYMLTAVGTTASGQSAESATILIDVERPDLPTSLSALLPGITFEAQGEQSPAVILATFSDGSVLDVTESSNVAYSSSNTSIAMVDAAGTVTGVAAGSASVRATYTQGTQSVQVAIPVTVPPPVLSPSPASLTFGSQSVGTSSSAQTLTLTNVSNGAIKVLSLSTTGDFSETDNCVSSSPLAATSTCTINVTFTPIAGGPRAGSVTIANSFNNLPMVIPLTGTGVVCHYVSMALSPSSVAVGGVVTVTGTVRSCTSATQTVVVQFTLTGPLQPGACGTTSSVMFTTPPFTLQPNTQQTVSFAFRIPNNTCPGSYTITATTSVGGTAVDTSSATLTVTP